MKLTNSIESAIKDTLHATVVSMMATEIAVWRNSREPTYEQVNTVMEEFYDRALEILRKESK